MSDNLLKWFISFFWAFVVMVYLLDTLEWIGAAILVAIIILGIAIGIRSDLDD